MRPSCGWNKHMWSSLNRAALGTSLTHFVGVNIWPPAARRTNRALGEDGWTGSGMEPLGLASDHLWWVLAASWSLEQFALVMHDPILVATAGPLLWLYGVWSAPPQKETHKGRLILPIVCVTFQNYRSMAFIKWMHVIPSYPQPIFHTDPTAHSSTLLFIPPWLTFIPFGPRLRVPIPSLSCHLIPLMEVFPLAQRQAVLPVCPRPR